MTQRQRRNLLLYPLLLPSFILVILYLYYPIFNSLYLSLFDIRNFNLDQMVFSGLKNYQKLVNDPIFWLSFRNTVILLGATILIQLPVAFYLADYMVNHLRKKHSRLEAWLLLALFFPVVLPTPVLAKTWRTFFLGMAGAGYGPFEWVCTKLGITDLVTQVLGTKTVLLLGEVNTAIWILIAVQTWARIGFNLLIYRSSILTIASEIYESAEIDGASAWDKLFRITIPLTKNVINLTIVLAVLGVFQLFDMAWMLTGAGTGGGGPMNTTHLLATYMYSRSFIDLRTGYGAAIAIMILVISLLISLVERRLFRVMN